MPYLIEVYAPGLDPVHDNPTETFGPYPNEEAVSRRFSQLVAADAESGALQRNFRIVEVPFGPDEVEESSDPGLPAELLTLLQLDPHGEGTVSAELASDICGRDRDQILAFIRVCEEQAIEWREAGREASINADVGDAEASFHESAAWDQTTALLRAALRVVVENPPESSTTS